MNFLPKNNLLARILLCALATFALKGIAQDLLPENYDASLDHPWLLEKINPDDDWTRHFRIGALVGFNIKGNFNMGGNFNVSYKNGVYDDGYVHPDSRNDSTYTSYFGGGQYNGSTITMNRVTSYSVTSGASGSSDAGPSPGFDLAYGDSYWYWAHGKLGWEFGVGILPIHIANSISLSPNSAMVTPAAYQFDASENPYIPPNYQGVYENDGNSPFGLPNLRNYQTPTVINGSPTPADGGTITRSLDVMLYTARLGPAVYWDWDEHVGFYASAGPAVGLVAGNLSYNDTITYNGGATSARSRGQISSTSITYGGYVNATLIYHAVAGGDFYLGAEFMPLSSATISGGGRSGKLDLSGQLYITAGINWPF